MEKNDFKKITKEWLLSKGFRKEDELVYICPLEGFDLMVLFIKDRFSEHFYFDIGFQLRNVQWGSGQVRVAVPSEKYWKHIIMADGSKNIVNNCFYYEEWSKDDYLEALENICQIYIQPYYDTGLKYWKKILQEQRYRGQGYVIGTTAREVISKM